LGDPVGERPPIGWRRPPACVNSRGQLDHHYQVSRPRSCSAPGDP